MTLGRCLLSIFCSRGTPRRDESVPCSRVPVAPDSVSKGSYQSYKDSIWYQSVEYMDLASARCDQNVPFSRTPVARDSVSNDVSSINPLGR